MLYTLPIVGAFYRPPAEAILKVLPVGAKLSLFAEPENPVVSQFEYNPTGASG